MNINFSPHIKSISQKVKPVAQKALKAFKTDCFTPSFKPIKYQKCETLRDIHNFVAIKFPQTRVITNNKGTGNRIVHTMCRLYNMTKGKILFPPEIQTYKLKKEEYSGEYNEGLIRLNVAYNTIESTLVHEIAHYNHEQFCPDYLKMGKESELIEDGIEDFSIFNEFNQNKHAKNLIKKYLRGYATSSACEFVACTLEAIYNGKTLPIEIWELYKKYSGPHADLLKPYFVKQKDAPLSAFLSKLKLTFKNLSN